MAVQAGCRGAWLACETRAGVLHAKHAAHWGKKLCAGPRRTSNPEQGLLLSTIGRRPQVKHALKPTQNAVEHEVGERATHRGWYP